MKTVVNGIDLKKGIELVKPFVGSLKKKTDSRPVLKTALVSEKYIVATNSHILIRISHGQSDQEPYLHHYKPSTKDYEVRNYPQTDRLIPSAYDAKQEFKININEWIEAHNCALIAAKEHKTVVTKLQYDKISVPATVTKLDEKTKKEVKVPAYDQIGYTYTLDTTTNIENVAYNCEYMLMMLKTFKKLKINEVTCYFYGPLRPMLFKDKDSLVEIVILPVRTY
jgi:acyl-CoA synthetase (AMP-forming)/AMP-acid ligase II